MSQFRNQLLPFLETARPTYLEYIKADGSQYFTIPLRTSGVTTYKFSITMTIDSALSAQDTILAIWGNQFYSAGTSGCNLRVWNSQGSAGDFGTKNYGEKFTLMGSVSNSTATVTVDGTTRTCNGIMTMTSGVYLLNWAGSQYPVNGKIYSCQFYEDNVMVHNFRPCLSGVNGEACFWDTVTQKYYYNGGTGEFGYEKNFLKLDYLQNNGLAYIDTGILTTANTWTHAKLYTISIDNRNWFGGSATKNGKDYVFNAFSSDSFEYNYATSGWNTGYVGNIVDCVFEVDFNKNHKILINGEEIVDLTSYTKTKDTLTMWLWLRNGGTGYVDGRCYEFSVYESNILIQDLIPVYRFDGTICMYDFITGSYFTNQGTGDFKGQFTDRGKVYEILPYIQSAQREGQIAYIDTGIRMEGNYGFVCNFTLPSNVRGNYCIFGASNGTTYSNGEIALFWNQSANNCFEYVYPTSNTISTVSRGPEHLANTYWNTVKSVNGPLSYNGIKYSTPDFYKDYVGQKTFFISGTNRFPSKWGGNAKFHYFKVEYRDGGVQQELVPVRSNGVTGMYDTVSKNVLVNANTTGDFVAPNILPNGYTRLDYIQNSGTQYIDTGILIDSSNENYVRIEVDGNFGTKISGSNKWSIDGTAYTNICRYIGISASDVLAYGNGGSSFDNYTNYTATETDRTGRHLYVVDYLNGKVKRDGVTVTSFTTLSSSTSQPAHNIYIFGWRVGREFQENAKKYGFRIYINDNCVFSGIPCKNPSNVVGMYDTISNAFLTTPSGTGTFTPGSPI